MRYTRPALVAALLTLSTALAQDVFFQAQTDPIEDFNTSFLGFTTEGFQSWDSQHGQLGVYCYDDTFMIAVITNGYLGTRDTVPVTFRFDTGEPTYANWHGTSDGNVVFAPVVDTPAFLQRLLTAERLAWRATAYDGDTFTLLFPIPATLRSHVERLGCVQLD